MSEEHMFKDYEKVLVRDSNTDTWRATFYSHYDKVVTHFPHCTASGRFAQCIPYEGNEHLVGTTDEPTPKWEPKRGDAVVVWNANYDDKKVRVFYGRYKNGSRGYFVYEDYRKKIIKEFYHCEPFNMEDDNE